MGSAGVTARRGGRRRTTMEEASATRSNAVFSGRWRFMSRHSTSGEEFLRWNRMDSVGCVILDLAMPGNERP